MLKRSIGVASGLAIAIAVACSASQGPNQTITPLDGTGGTGTDITGGTGGVAGSHMPWMTSMDPNGADQTGIIGGTPIRQLDAASPTKCVAVANQGKQVTVDIFIMFDQSLSMSCPLPGPSTGAAGAAGATGTAGAPASTGGAAGAAGAAGAPTGAGGAPVSTDTRWTAVKKALEQFVSAPAAAGINVGIQYFGIGGGLLGGLMSSCNYMDYQSADVEIAELPGNAPPIIQSLERHQPSTNTPTPPALIGAINHAIDWKNAHPGHAVIVLLVTDGQPNGCGAVSDVVQVAGAGFGNTIPTYVIGVISPGTTCSTDQNPPNQADLDAVAKAGGTEQAFMVDLSKDTVQQFLAATDKIRDKSTVPCQYAVPAPPMGETLDPMKVNVEYTSPGAMMPTTLNYVAAGACDPTKGGWYYDNPLMPKTITLCQASCDLVKKQVSGSINIALGCARKITQ